MKNKNIFNKELWPRTFMTFSIFRERRVGWMLSTNRNFFGPFPNHKRKTTLNVGTTRGQWYFHHFYRAWYKCKIIYYQSRSETRLIKSHYNNPNNTLQKTHSRLSRQSVDWLVSTPCCLYNSYFRWCCYIRDVFPRKGPKSCNCVIYIICIYVSFGFKQII